MEYVFSFIIAFLFGACTLVIGVQNPIHSILILISVFLLGSILLFMLHVEYLAILLVIVYVGAIVVLFLFIVMMLEIKTVNASERFRDMFSYRNFVVGFILLEVLLLSTEDVFDVAPLISFVEDPEASIYFKESNLYVDYSKLLQPTSHIRGIGGVLFTEYKTSLMIVGFLLFLAMVGSIVLTLEEDSFRNVKGQDVNNQAIRHPVLLETSFREE